MAATERPARSYASYLAQVQDAVEADSSDHVDDLALTLEYHELLVRQLSQRLDVAIEELGPGVWPAMLAAHALDTRSPSGVACPSGCWHCYTCGHEVAYEAEPGGEPHMALPDHSYDHLRVHHRDDCPPAAGVRTLAVSLPGCIKREASRPRA